MKEVSMRRCLRTAVLAGLVVWVWLVHVNGSQPIVPEKDIEMSLTFSSEPELGKQFAVTFIFTPREQILHASELDDVAEIHFDRGVELISGVPKWEGRLAKGKTETIQIVVKVTEPGHYTFAGAVASCRSDPRRWRKVLEMETKMAEEIFEKIFRFHNYISHTLCIGEPDLQRGKEIWVYDASTGKARKARISDDAVPLASSLRSGQERVRDVEKPWGEFQGADEPEKTTDVVEYGFLTTDAAEWVEDEGAYLVGRLKLSKGKPVLVFLYDAVWDEIIQADFEIRGDCCRLRRLPDGKAELILLQDRCRCSIVGIHTGVRYLIKVVSEEQEI